MIRFRTPQFVIRRDHFDLRHEMQACQAEIVKTHLKLTGEIRQIDGGISILGIVGTSELYLRPGQAVFILYHNTDADAPVVTQLGIEQAKIDPHRLTDFNTTGVHIKNGGLIGCHK